MTRSRLSALALALSLFWSPLAVAAEKPQAKFVGHWFGLPTIGVGGGGKPAMLVVAADGRVNLTQLHEGPPKQWTGERWIGGEFAAPFAVTRPSRGRRGKWLDGDLVFEFQNALRPFGGVPPAATFSADVEEDRLRLVAKTADGKMWVFRRFPDKPTDKDLPAFLDALKGGGDQLDRLWAAHGIASLGDKAGRAVPQLVEALRGDDSLLRKSASVALVAIGKPAAEALVPLLGDGKHRDAAMRILTRELGPLSRDALVDVYRKRESELRIHVAAALAHVDLDTLHAEAKDDPKIADDLAAATRHKDGRVRQRSIRAVSLLGIDAVRLRKILLALLREHPDAATRKSAIFAIWNVGVDDAHVDGLTKALKDEDYLIRRTAGMLLCQIGEAGEPALLDVAGLLKEESVWVRGPVARGLGDMGPRARPAAEELLAALSREQAKQHPHQATVASLRYGFARVTDRQSEVVPLLIDLVNSGNGAERQWAMEMLKRIGPDAKSATPALVKAIRTNGPGAFAAEALAAIGPEAAEATVTLVDGLDDKNPYSAVRHAAALARIGSRPKLAMDELKRFLKHPFTGVRLYAAETLGELGPRASEAIESLEQCRDDRSRRVREKASQALSEIKRER